MPILPLLALQIAAPQAVLFERVDVYDPVTSAYRGAERTWWDADGRRLRLEVTDADGEPSLLFFVRHDAGGREQEAIYFEGSPDPSWEVFTYSRDGRRKTTTYYYEPDRAADRTVADLDASGREVHKRYYRADGTQYGEEDVLWNAGGTQLGWDFRYVGRDVGTSFRYTYEPPLGPDGWTRRLRSRNGVPERSEVRTRIRDASGQGSPTPGRFAPGVVSTGASETSPSFTRDGRTMVFARYDEWAVKRPFIGHLEESGWRVEPLDALGQVYNLGIAPDGEAIIYTPAERDERALFRVRRSGSGWSRPEDLTRAYGVRGAYAALDGPGSLYVYDADGPAGEGVYVARRSSDGFAPPEPVFVPSVGTAFDPYPTRDGILVTTCVDEVCASGPENGVWLVPVPDGGPAPPVRLPNVPYAWGVQPVEALGLLVFTDGEDILMLPLDYALARSSGGR